MQKGEKQKKKMEEEEKITNEGIYQVGEASKTNEERKSS